MAAKASGKALAMVLLALGLSTGVAQAQQCGNNSNGFNAWKAEFRQQAANRGVGQRALAALDGTRYNNATISADRGQKSFRLTLDQFMERRGAAAIVRRGKQLKQQNAQLFSSIERQYGVPAGVLLAIWGMETNFGGYMGNQNIVSAVATLAYDCRRSEFFTRQLWAALQLVDNGSLRADAIGAAHGEVGQTQFLPENVIKFGIDGDGDGRVDLIRSRADALYSTANFLRGHGWRPGAGYQPGEPNYRAIQGWNAAGVYQQAIAIMGRQIDG
ncbi:lytic murein transglycosylase [Mesorhizobium microcysteis]|uniref:Lytic murein transglycosylase n=1 Tax=Neoaquamicrobium microcysteis TaxID=2682781 RepID=A0A5D4GVQ8_9HYPH|nr:lytic murein transglycosylase [Mesorhizobium microcysteis]TYR31365.1 lytic murein transglycosylase [Mesorhizobium microcysteis]